MKPIRYREDMVNEFLNDGYWTQETFYDFWDRNAREYGDREALVDSPTGWLVAMSATTGRWSEPCTWGVQALSTRKPGPTKMWSMRTRGLWAE